MIFVKHIPGVRFNSIFPDIRNNNAISFINKFEAEKARILENERKKQQEEVERKQREEDQRKRKEEDDRIRQQEK